MTNFKLSTGHDNEAGFNTITFPLECRGVQYPEYQPMPDGTVLAKGAPYAVLEQRNMKQAEFNAIFTYAGITMTDGAVLQGDVTVALPDVDRTAAFNNWNGTLIWRPGTDGEFYEDFWHNVRFTIKALVAT